MWKGSLFTCCIIAICAGVSIANSVEGDFDFGPHEVKRQNSPSGINETQVLTIACDLNPQNHFAVCVEQLTAYINSSALAWCQHEQEVLDDCLVANKYSESNCTNQIFNYNNCANATVAMYMTCLATFTMPMDLYECANVNLFEGYTLPPTTSIATSTLPTSSLSVFNTLTGPVVASTTSSSSTTPVSESTTTITGVITVTACPPDISNCPTSSTYLSTITRTSVTSFGGGTTRSRSGMPAASTSATSTTTVTRGAREADLCGLKKRTRVQRRDEV